METPKVGELCTVSSLPLNEFSYVPQAPIGEQGDSGVINKIGSNFFHLLRDDGEVRSYPFNVTRKAVGSVAALTAQLRKALGIKYNTILSKGGSFLLGSDPEIFVLDENQTVIPAWEFLPKVPDHMPTHKGVDNFHDAAAFYDGVQAEFTTVPALCLAYHVDSIQAGFQCTIDAARKYNPAARLSSRPVVEVPQHVLDTAEETYVMLGCAPSENIYPDVHPIRIDNPRALNLRFAGGHQHYGKKIPSDQLPQTIKSLDRILAVTATAMLDGLDDCRRRSYYGRAGEFRLPPHGLEYRTLSSACNMHPAMTHLCFDLGRQTIWAAEHGYASLWNASEEESRSAIDNSDYKLARKIVRRNLSYLRAVFMAIYGLSVTDPVKATTTALRLILEGARNLLPDNLEQNWKLNAPLGSDEGWMGHSLSKGTSIGNLQIG